VARTRPSQTSQLCQGSKEIGWGKLLIVPDPRNSGTCSASIDEGRQLCEQNPRFKAIAFTGAANLRRAHPEPVDEYCPAQTDVRNDGTRLGGNVPFAGRVLGIEGHLNRYVLGNRNDRDSGAIQPVMPSQDTRSPLRVNGKAPPYRAVAR